MFISVRYGNADNQSEEKPDWNEYREGDGSRKWCQLGEQQPQYTGNNKESPHVQHRSHLPPVYRTKRRIPAISLGRDRVGIRASASKEKGRSWEASQRYGIPYGSVLDYICLFPSGLELRMRAQRIGELQTFPATRIQVYEPGFMIHTL